MQLPDLLLEEILKLLCLEELLPLRSINSQFLQTINQTLLFNFNLCNREPTVPIETFLPKLGKYIKSIFLSDRDLNHTQLIINHCPNLTSIKLIVSDSDFFNSASIFSSAQQLLQKGNIRSFQIHDELINTGSLLNGVQLEQLILGSSRSIFLYETCLEMLTDIYLPELKGLTIFTSEVKQSLSELVQAKFPMLEELVISDDPFDEDKLLYELVEVYDPEAVEYESKDMDFYKEEYFNGLRKRSLVGVFGDEVDESIKDEGSPVRLGIDSDSDQMEEDESEQSVEEEESEDEDEDDEESDQSSDEENNNNFNNMEWADDNNNNNTNPSLFKINQLPQLTSLSITLENRAIPISLPQSSYIPKLKNLNVGAASLLEFKELNSSVWKSLIKLHLITNSIDQDLNIPHHLPNIKDLLISQDNQRSIKFRILELKDYTNLESLSLVNERNSKWLIKIKPELNLLKTLKLCLGAAYLEHVLNYCYQSVPKLISLEVLCTDSCYTKLPKLIDTSICFPLITSLTIAIEDEDSIKFFQLCSTTFPNLVKLDLNLEYIDPLISSLTTPGCDLLKLKSLTLTSQEVTQLAELLEFCTINLPQLEELILPDLTRVHTSVLLFNESKFILTNLLKFYTKSPLPVEVYLKLFSLAPKLFSIRPYLNFEQRLVIRESVGGDRLVIFQKGC